MSQNSILIATQMHVISNQEVETNNICLQIYGQIVQKKNLIKACNSDEVMRNQMIKGIQNCMVQSRDWPKNQVK